MAPTEQFIDFGSNPNVKVYLVKKGVSGLGAEIEGIVSDHSIEMGERAVEKINFLGSNFAMFYKPSELGTIELTIASSKDSISALEMALGDGSTASGVTTIVGDSDLTPHRLIVEQDTDNYTTGKTESRRITIVNLLGTKATWKYTADDKVEITISGAFANPNMTYEKTDDKTLSPLPTPSDYL